jgi:hypothetical protein
MGLFLGIVIGAVIAGGLVYWFLQNQLEQQKQEDKALTEKRIQEAEKSHQSRLQDTIKSMQKEQQSQLKKATDDAEIAQARVVALEKIHQEEIAKLQAELTAAKAAATSPVVEKPPIKPSEEETLGLEPPIPSAPVETKADTPETPAEVKLEPQVTPAPETKADTPETPAEVKLEPQVTPAPETKADTSETPAEVKLEPPVTPAPETKADTSETPAEVKTDASATAVNAPVTDAEETAVNSQVTDATEPAVDEQVADTGKKPTALPPLYGTFAGNRDKKNIFRQEEPTLSQEILALGNSGNTTHIAKLVDFTSHPDSEIRAAAATSLGQIGAGGVRTEVQRTIPLLGKLSQVSDSVVRQAAVAALGKIQSPQVIPLLQKALRDTDSNVVKSASAALDKYKSYRVIPKTKVANVAGSKVKK